MHTFDLWQLLYLFSFLWMTGEIDVSLLWWVNCQMLEAFIQWMTFGFQVYSPSTHIFCPWKQAKLLPKTKGLPCNHQMSGLWQLVLGSLCPFFRETNEWQRIPIGIVKQFPISPEKNTTYRVFTVKTNRNLPNPQLSGSVSFREGSFHIKVTNMFRWLKWRDPHLRYAVWIRSMYTGNPYPLSLWGTVPPKLGSWILWWNNVPAKNLLDT